MILESSISGRRRRSKTHHKTFSKMTRIVLYVIRRPWFHQRAQTRRSIRLRLPLACIDAVVTAGFFCETVWCDRNREDVSFLGQGITLDSCYLIDGSTVGQSSNRPINCSRTNFFRMPVGIAVQGMVSWRFQKSMKKEPDASQL